MGNGPIIIDKFGYEHTENDFRTISKNFKVLHLLYCALTINIYESILHCHSAKEFGKLFVIYMVLTRMWC